MKVLPFIIPKPDKAGLIYELNIAESFYDKLHQHDEIQLSYIVAGTGTLVVGDTINNYHLGDVFVIGSNSPHVFKSDAKSHVKSQMINLFFTKQSFGDTFFDLEELKEIQPFFNRSKFGFKLESKISDAQDLFLQLNEASKLNKFLVLLKLLSLMVSADYTSLSSFVYDKKYSVLEGDRMRNVFEFTLNNYDKPITLDEVSEAASMTKNAFCKYFKKRTNKTYIQFLNEFRVEKSMKLLKDNNDYNIAEIAFRCGFRNISNFNKTFKNIKGKSPSKFR